MTATRGPRVTTRNAHGEIRGSAADIVRRGARRRAAGGDAFDKEWAAKKAPTLPTACPMCGGVYAPDRDRFDHRCRNTPYDAERERHAHGYHYHAHPYGQSPHAH